MWSKISSFGTKGVDSHAKTFAEQLLSGKPMARAPQKDNRAVLKPRVKSLFGRKAQDRTPASCTGTEAQPHGRVRMLRHGWFFWLSVWVAGLLGLQALAGVFDWPSPTLGGRQLWTDVRVQGGWRVQCHAWTGHCRLLDDRDIRRTWGSEADVLSAMDEALGDGRIAASRARHAVVLVHGLGRSAHSLDDLAEELETKGYDVVTFTYASTQGTIAQHAQALNRVVAGLQGIDEVSFVTHSLGGVVVRQALALKPEWRKNLKAGASVLLAAPNQGSAVARTLSAYAPARWLFGPALGELADGPTIQALPQPTPFATVSGSKNPLWFLTTESDGLVSVEETHLPGEAAHIDVAAAHTFIMNDNRVIAFVDAFIAGH